MPLPTFDIQHIQYGDITDSKVRMAFRAELFKLLISYNEHGMRCVLKIQNEASLVRLVASINSLLAQNIPSVDKNKYKRMLSHVNAVLLGKQQCVPVAFDELVHDLGDARNSCIIITKNDDEPHFRLTYHDALDSTMRAVFTPYEYRGAEVRNWAMDPGMMDISKVSIQGRESAVGTALSREILNRKAEIITLLKEKVLRRQQRCQSDTERQNDPKLQQLSSQIQHKLQELDELARDPRAEVVQILSAIDSTYGFTHAVDRAIDQFNKDVSIRKSKDALAGDSCVNAVLLEKQQGVPVAFDVLVHDLGDARNSCIIITKNDAEPHFRLTYHDALDSTMREVFTPYEYRGAETHGWARGPGMMDISKVSIQGKESAVGTALSREILNRKAEIITLLKEKVLRRQQRCQSDTERQNDPKLQQLSSQIQHKLQELDELARDPRAEVVQILSAIDSTYGFTHAVDRAIDQFEQDVSIRKSTAALLDRLAQSFIGSSSQHLYSEDEISNPLRINPRAGDS